MKWRGIESREREREIEKKCLLDTKMDGTFTGPALVRAYYPRFISGLNIANKMKHIYYSFSITNLQKSKGKFSKLKILYK